jgi:hypothetical protein
MNNESKLKKLAEIVTYTSFAADLLAVAHFIYQLFQQDTVLEFEAALPSVAVIVIVFLFSFFLLLYSKDEITDKDYYTKVFSWLYVLFAALILAIKSWHFFNSPSYNFGDLFGYMLLVALIFGLGFSVSFVMESFTKNFAAPFFVIALEQIALWVKNMLSKNFSFDVYFVGTIFLFIFTSLIILFTLRFEKVPNFFASQKK